MAGHMGAERVTVQNLSIIRTDVDQGLILVRGSVPGQKGCWVEISDAVKASLPEDVPFPAGVRGGSEPAAEEEPAEVIAEEAVAEDAPAGSPDAAEDNDEKKE